MKLRRRRQQADSGDPVDEGFHLGAMVAEFGPIGCLLAPVAGLIFWLWRRSRSSR